MTTIFFIMFSLQAWPCPKITGTWKSCSIQSNFLNTLERAALNIVIRGYYFKFKNPKEGHLESKIIKDNFLSADETIHHEIVPIGKKNRVKWSKNPIEGSTPPDLTTTLTCNNFGMIETIVWNNLTVANYPDHETKDFPKYFKNEYIVQGSKAKRMIFAKKSLELNYTLIAIINCQKTN